MTQAGNVTVDATLDATGLLCPLPVLKARRALKPLAAGAVSRSARHRPRRDQGFRAFLRDDRLRAARSRANRPGGSLAFCHAQAGLTEAFHGRGDHDAASDGGRRRCARRTARHAARGLGLAHPLIVTDPFIAALRASRAGDGTISTAPVSPWTVFSDTVADPTTAVVETGDAPSRRGRFRQPRRDRRRQLDRHRQRR